MNGKREIEWRYIGLEYCGWFNSLEHIKFLCAVYDRSWRWEGEDLKGRCVGSCEGLSGLRDGVRRFFLVFGSHTLNLLGWLLYVLWAGHDEKGSEGLLLVLGMKVVERGLENRVENMGVDIDGWR